MMRYSVQHRYGIFVKVYKCFSFAKNNHENVGRNIIKNLSGKYTPVMLAARQKLLIMLKKYATDALKTSPKRLFKKQQKQLVILLGIKLLIELGNFQKIQNKVIQKKLQLSMIKKYLKRFKLYNNSR